MQVTRIQVKTTWFYALITIVLSSVFISLGVWQLNRAQEKMTIRDQVLARQQLPEVTVGPELLDAGEMVFRYAVAEGRYVEELQILLDNKVHRGRAGYHVLTPLLLSESNTLLLVNRGWVPWGQDRQRLPRIDVPRQEITVRGRLSKPVVHAVSFEHGGENGDFPMVWQNLDLQKYESLTEHKVHKLVMQLDGGADEGSELVREWPRYKDGWIQRHHGYAVQWFGLALVLVLVFLFSSLKRTS